MGGMDMVDIVDKVDCLEQGVLGGYERVGRKLGKYHQLWGICQHAGLYFWRCFPASEALCRRGLAHRWSYRERMILWTDA